MPKENPKFENALLEDLLRVFDREILRTASGDVFGRINEYFLMKFAMQGAQDNGEFFTPPSIVQTIVNVIEPNRGIVFDPASVIVEEIRKEAGYGGVRVVIAGELAKARCKTQIDVGFGDAVTPGPVDSVYPVLLNDLPAPRLRAYPTYTVVAEKLHAIALLGMTNSRVKDYFDLSVLLERETLDADLLAQAIKATFERRGMAVPAALPVGLTDEFAHDASRQALWLSFVKKNELDPEPLAAIVGRLRLALEPALNRAAR